MKLQKEEHENLETKKKSMSKNNAELYYWSASYEPMLIDLKNFNICLLGVFLTVQNFFRRQCYFAALFWPKIACMASQCSLWNGI